MGETIIFYLKKGAGATTSTPILPDNLDTDYTSKFLEMIGGKNHLVWGSIVMC